MDKMEKIIHAQTHYSDAFTAWHTYLFIYLFVFYVYVHYKKKQSAWK